MSGTCGTQMFVILTMCHVLKSRVRTPGGEKKNCDEPSASEYPRNFGYFFFYTTVNTFQLTLCCRSDGLREIRELKFCSM